MGAIGLYVPGSSKAARALLRDLNAIAKRFGYVASTAGTQGEGAFGRMMVGIADREVLLVRNSPGLALGLKAFLTDHPDQEWAEKMLDEIS